MKDMSNKRQEEWKQKREGGREGRRKRCWEKRRKGDMGKEMKEIRHKR